MAYRATFPGMLAAVLAAAAPSGCADDVPATSDGDSETAAPTTDDPTGSPTEPQPDLCSEQGVACGEQAHCDPVDGRCYCDAGTFGDPEAGCTPHGDLCGEAAERVGHSVCRHEVADVLTWDSLSLGWSKRKDVRKVSKYIAPADPSAPLPTLFNDTNQYRLHLCMLKEAFEPLFPEFTQTLYNKLVYWRSGRQMYAGNIYEFSGEDLPIRYGFTVQTPDDADELLTEPEAYYIYRTLQDRFSLGEIGYAPNSDVQEAAALAWENPRVKIVLGGDEVVNYEAYSTGTAYGRIRSYDADEVASASGTFGWQDIVVLASAPSDLRGVASAVITGARQDVLSHLNVLAAQRGTPNAYVATPLAAFAPVDGQLVRLIVTEANYSVVPATLAEAEAFWADNRPSVAVGQPPDPDYFTLQDVLAIPAATASERDVARGRFGGKVTGLATLYTSLDPSLQTPALGIPTAHYLKFMEDNSWELIVDGKPVTWTFAATIDAWLDDPTFRSDTAVRKAWLAALSAAMVQRGKVDPALLTALRGEIAAVFGGEDVMVRLRSSSNAEDSLEFNGAGLYTSESACPLDPDGSGGGASACDKNKGRRPLDEALKIVWASLWGFGAFEEREYYQMDHREVAMGLLVSTRYEAEQANGVAFTGNPIDPDDNRFTINVQLGEVDVVAPPDGTTAELDRLEIADGEVVAIERVAGSSLVEPGEVVLTDDQLEQLGAVLAEIQAVYPVELGDHAADEVLLDLEFKITGEGQLIIKQIRTFLRSALDPSLPSCL
jgi:pyruvate,water dikinase